MAAPILKFPAPSRDVEAEKKELTFTYRQKPAITKFTKAEVNSLLITAQRVYEKALRLIEVTDAHRETAVSAGIETIAIELGSERSSLEAIIDVLEESHRKGREGELTLEGVALLRRLEKLVAEAGSNLSRFTRAPARGEAALGSSNIDTMIWVPAVVFGLSLVAVIVYGIFSGKKD